MTDVNRRSFIRNSAVAVSAASMVWSSTTPASASSPLNKLVVGVMGVNGRGSSLARGFAQQKDCEIAYVCDVDERALEKGVGAVKGIQDRVPETIRDFRKMLDDKSVDILVVAAPNHWHAPATILGCSAGKHVYVEKPCSHTAQEGEWAVAAARKNNRVVTMGSQRRSYPILREAIDKLHSGAIGKLLFARSWYSSRRGDIGFGKQVDVPNWLDYQLWQGPCTDKPYKDNLIHYNWHWHWHWGNGELGNNGVHALDVARWGMNVDYPSRVTSAGGRYRWVDDQETADTHVVSFEFGKSLITWEGLSWSPQGPMDGQFGVTFHGEEGTMYVYDAGYKIYDMMRKLSDQKDGSAGDAEHFDNFLKCIREGGKPNADIEDAHKSTLLCHLGNIALRTGRTLNTDPQNGHILQDEEAAKMWSKEYRSGWEPVV